MDNSFDRLLKQKLAGQSPESLGFRPDREKLWQQVEAKRKKKTRLIPLWLSHTAAVAAGLAVGFFFLSREEKTRPEQQPVAVHQPAATRPQTVSPPQAGPEEDHRAGTTVAQHNKHHPTSSLPDVRPTTTETPPLPAVPEMPESQPEMVREEPVIATTARQAPQVLHLADMDNENALPKGRNKTAFGEFVPANLRQPEGNAKALSAAAAGLFTQN
ncbi:hypothetical protein [Taibaiella koreensis]|uniref:hypothetical protein n=1 Tax=Taibaiella koreensis TaxID=1268548 RepID=UPI000E59FC15|nr:hypothetical protein [Taibaiella koreensis]